MAKPSDSESRKIGAKAEAILHYKINPNHWSFKQETGNDFGRDCIIELSEQEEWRNHKIEGQIKGTKSPIIVKNDFISFPMPVKTIEYALGASNAFILFVINIITEDIFFQCIQKYFIEHPELFYKLDQQTINIRIPVNQNLTINDALLQKWALKNYLKISENHIREDDVY